MDNKSRIKNKVKYMSINRMYYGTKKIYSFLENGNQGGECNCEQEYQNGYNQGYQDGLANCTGGAGEECTLGTGAITLTTADAGRYELFASDDGYDGWSKFIVELEGGVSGGDNVFSVIGWDDNDTATLFSPVLNESMKALEQFNNREDKTICSLLYRDNISLSLAPKLDMENVIYTDIMFYNCLALVVVPDIYAPNLEVVADMFGGCRALSKAPFITTENVTNFYRMFAGCDNLKYVPSYNTSNATECYEMFYDCVKLESLPQFDFSKVENDLGNFFGFSELSNLTNIGGFIGLKIDWNNDCGLYRCPNLTYESIMNVINGLYDFRGNGDNDTVRTLKIHTNTMALLSDDDKQIATNKGWMLTE